MIQLPLILFVISQLSCFTKVVIANDECRLCRVDKLLKTYQSQHSVKAVLNEKPNQFCSRNFVKSVFYCSSSTDKHQIGIGTVWGSNLVNDLAISIILNRTLIVEYRFQDCGGYVSAPDWILTTDEAARIATEKGCALPPSNHIEPLKPCFQCFFNLNSTFDRVVNLEPWYWKSVYNLYHLDNGGVLTATQRETYNILYSNPTSNTSFEGAGILLENVIEFTDTMKQVVQKAMEPLRHEEYISISMHLRHQDGDADAVPLTEHKYKAYDHQFVKCFHEIRRRFRNRKCVLYVATDRPQSLSYVTNRTASMDCEVRTAPRDTISDPKQFNGEHGYVTHMCMYYIYCMYVCMMCGSVH